MCIYILYNILCINILYIYIYKVVTSTYLCKVQQFFILKWSCWAISQIKVVSRWFLTIICFARMLACPWFMDTSWSAWLCPSRVPTLIFCASQILTYPVIRVHPNKYWLVVSTLPLWKIWVRQWEGLSHILWKILLPSGYVKIAIENGHRNSEFSH